MPLLIRLGTLLTEIRDVDVYQFHREPKGWAWPSVDQGIDLRVDKPTYAMVFLRSLSRSAQRLTIQE